MFIVQPLRLFCVTPFVVLKKSAMFFTTKHHDVQLSDVVASRTIPIWCSV